MRLGLACKELQDADGTPTTIESTRRSALQPFTLSNGTKLEVGDWACTPVRAIMQNSKSYPEPLEFNGFRFVDPLHLGPKAGNFKVLQTKPSKLTDIDDTFHVWGTGRMAWCDSNLFIPNYVVLLITH